MRRMVYTVTEATLDGKHQMIFKDRVKTKKSYRTLPLVKDFEFLLLQKRKQIAENKKMFGNQYKTEYDSYICVDTIGDLLKPGFITQNFTIILRKNNLKRIRFHDLRHSCATLLRHEGVPMEDIQKWLGHSNITTTEKIYAHFEDERHWNSAHKITNALSIGGYADDEDLYDGESHEDSLEDISNDDLLVDMLNEDSEWYYDEEYDGYETEKKDYEM